MRIFIVVVYNKVNNLIEIQNEPRDLLPSVLFSKVSYVYVTVKTYNQLLCIITDSIRHYT